MIAAVVPAVAFALLLPALRPHCFDMRTAFLAAAVGWGVIVVAVTELLSAVHALRFGPVVVAWVAVVAVLAWRAWRGWTTSVAMERPTTLSGFDLLVLAGMGALAAAIAVVAVLAPPNTYDSMTYHMSRVAHWAQEQSVTHYPTSIIRQLSQPPWAEFAILQFYVLTGGDRLANLVQWVSLVGAALGVSAIAERLGGDRRAQILAAAVALTIPMGVAQASGTKNDCVVAFWLVCLAVFILTLNVEPSGARAGRWIALAGCAFGLAVLTKGTAYLLAAPLVAGAWFVRIRRDRWRAWAMVIGLALMATAINGPHMARNIARFGSPVGPLREGPYEYVNGAIGLRSTLSVAVRNAGLHLGTPWNPVNALTDGAIRAIHRALGMDVDDPATTWWGTHFQVSTPKRHEDMVSNGLHLGLIGLTVLALAARPELRTANRVAYAAALVVAFALFCAVLRWQPWHSRLHLPLFVLWAPLIGIALARWPAAGALGAAALASGAAVVLLAGEPRPLFSVLREPRAAQYFRNRPEWRGPYTGAVNLLAQKSCARIGLQLGSNDWEYPLWVLARAAIPGARLEHVTDSEFSPWAIVATAAAERPEIARSGALYRREFYVSPVAVFVKVSGAR